MRPGIRIAVTLLAVLALIRPFDCFTSGVRTREAAACCLKGQCYPRANSDDCCKNSVPDDNRLVAPGIICHHFELAVPATASTGTLVAPPVLQRLTNELRHPSPRPPPATVNLPLLI
jgi:hypothetical protein